MSENGPTGVDPVPPPATLLQMMTGYWVSQALYVAAKLGVADLLADGPRPVEALAATTQTDASSLRRVLRALASVGVFTEARPGTFALTPLAVLLRTGTPDSMRALAIMHNTGTTGTEGHAGTRRISSGAFGSRSGAEERGPQHLPPHPHTDTPPGIASPEPRARRRQRGREAREPPPSAGPGGAKAPPGVIPEPQEDMGKGRRARRPIPLRLDRIATQAQH